MKGRRLQVINQAAPDASPSDGKDARYAERHHHVSHDRLGAEPSDCRGEPAVSGGRPEVVPVGCCGSGSSGGGWRRAEIQSCDGRCGRDPPRLSWKNAAAGPEDAVLPEPEWERDRREHLHRKSDAGKTRTSVTLIERSL